MAKIIGKETVPKVFQTFNSLLGGITRKRNATIVGPSKQLVGEFPEVNFDRLYQYYHHWPQIKTSIDVMHQKFRGSGINIKSNNEYFNVFVEKWWDVANAEKKFSQFIYSLLITGSAVMELQYTPDGRLGNVEQIPMQTIYRIFRDQFGNELKLVQVVDGVFKELDPQYFIHESINNPDRQAFGKSMFHPLASPRPVASKIDPFTGEAINPTRNSISILDAQAELQNAEVEIKKKMAKPRLIVSAPQMQKDQMDKIQAEMADPYTEQYIWVLDKPVTSAELQVQANGKFDEYQKNIDEQIDIGTVFASNVIKNPQGFSYSGTQTPFDVLDQRMMDVQTEFLEVVKDRLLKPLAESWGFIDFDAMEVEVSFTPTMKRLTIEDINGLDKEAVSKKELREMYKKLNIPLDDMMWEEEQNELKADKADQKNIQMQAALTGGMNPENGKPTGGAGKDGKPPFDGKFGDDEDKGDSAGSVKAPKSPTTKPQTPFEQDRPKPEPNKGSKPRGESFIGDLIKQIANESTLDAKSKIEAVKALERINLPPMAGNMMASTDLYVSQGIDDEEEKPQITDPDLRKVYGIDKDDSETPPTDPAKNARVSDKPQLLPADNTKGRFTNQDNMGIDQIPEVSQEEYEKHLAAKDNGDAYTGGTGNDGINQDSDGTFKDPTDAAGDLERTPETGNTAIPNPHPRPNQPPLVNNNKPFNDSGGSDAFPDNTKDQLFGDPDDDEDPIVPSEGFPSDKDPKVRKKKEDEQNLGEAIKPHRDIIIGEDPMTSGIMMEDDEEIQKPQARLDDSPLSEEPNADSLKGINPSRTGGHSNSTVTTTPKQSLNNTDGDKPVTPDVDQTNAIVGDSNQARLKKQEQTGIIDDALDPVDGIMDNTGMNVKPDSEPFNVVSQDEYLRKTQDGSNPLEPKGAPLEDGLVMKPEDVQQNDGMDIKHEQMLNDPTQSGIDEEEVDPNILHKDPETGRNYTDLTDEQGNPVPDLRFDQTPTSDEEQPEVELPYEIVTKEDYEAHLNGKQSALTPQQPQLDPTQPIQQPALSEDDLLDPVEKDEQGNPKELGTVDDIMASPDSTSTGDDLAEPDTVEEEPASKPKKKSSSKKTSKKSSSKKEDKKPEKKEDKKESGKKESGKKDGKKSDKKDTDTVPHIKGDVDEIIKREHDLIEKGVPEDEVHDILLDEFGEKDDKEGKEE